MIVWALFDSGNGCYKQAVDQYFPDIEVYPIGIDVENKNDHFINLNLADYSEIFGGGGIFSTLDKLPRPDVILASPPCESWSQMQNIKNGSFMWKDAEEVECLFSNHVVKTPFTVQTKSDYIKGKDAINIAQGFTYKGQFERDFKRRINGELCVVNTLEIIRRYEPKVWVIENPAYGKMWSYLKIVHDFKGIENLAHYNDYDADWLKKPTIFLSNIFLDLKANGLRSKKQIRNKTANQERIMGYNERSNIPLLLIKHILERCKEVIENDTECNGNYSRQSE